MTILCGALLAGCVTTTERPGVGFGSAFAAYESNTDSTLVHGLVEKEDAERLVPLSSVMAGGYVLRDVTSEWIRFGTKQYQDQAGAFRPVKADRDYSRIPEQDPLAVQYSRIAQERGNVVKVYKFDMNRIIASIMPLTFERSSGGKLNFSRDYALIEMDRDDQPVSVLVREHEELGFFVYVNSIVFMGQNMMNRISGKISNDKFKDTYLRTMK